ncbi:hypothetical protein HDU92_000162 [Lobulomyces angularis]|nr:hypothetical protein HDU92_000162 [Lobulomyces angularis]
MLFSLSSDEEEDYLDLDLICDSDSELEEEWFTSPVSNKILKSEKRLSLTQFNSLVKKSLLIEREAKLILKDDVTEKTKKNEGDLTKNTQFERDIVSKNYLNNDFSLSFGRHRKSDLRSSLSSNATFRNDVINKDVEKYNLSIATKSKKTDIPELVSPTSSMFSSASTDLSVSTKCSSNTSVSQSRSGILKSVPQYSMHTTASFRVTPTIKLRQPSPSRLPEPKSINVETPSSRRSFSPTPFNSRIPSPSPQEPFSKKEMSFTKAGTSFPIESRSFKAGSLKRASMLPVQRVISPIPTLTSGREYSSSRSKSPSATTISSSSFSLGKKNNFSSTEYNAKISSSVSSIPRPSSPSLIPILSASRKPKPRPHSYIPVFSYLSKKPT